MNIQCVYRKGRGIMTFENKVAVITGAGRGMGRGIATHCAQKGMKLVLAEELLEDEDLLEMMNAGLIQMIVIDSHKGKFWAQIFKELTLHPDIKLRTGGRIAWAIRKNNPKLKKMTSDFWKTHKKGTLMGNILFKRYLQNTKWVRNALNKEERKRFEEALGFFKKYSKQYDFDWLMIAD